MARAPTDSSEQEPATSMDEVLRAVARVDPLPTLAPGQILDGTYELIGRIGGGGMGVVFRARDRRLGRDVAVKVVKPCEGAAKERLRRLFEREARATAQLLHPNIVTLHHVGEHDGHPYLVLELLSGETLATRLARRGRMPVAEALAILDAVLGALAFAHERGVLHRDLKPNNVFLTVDDRVKVLDFGVALSLDSEPGPVTRAAGTPGYMAPEQRDGADQDARTDVWAAALLLVECLSGRRPDESAAASAVAELEVPAAIRGVLERALSIDPAKRPGSAAELRFALPTASGRLAPPPAPPPRWSRRIALGAGVLAAGAALGGAVTYWRTSDLDASMGSALATPRSAPSKEEVSATYTLNFGVLLLRVDSEGRAYGVYQHDDGIIVGHYYDGLFLGRWCEQPSYKGPDDAGKLEIRFAHNANRVQAEGRWTYGDERYAPWQSDWGGHTTPTTPPPGLVKRLEQGIRCP